MALANKSHSLPARGRFLGLRRPLNRWATLMQSAVSQVEIDEILIRHTEIGRHLFEVFYGCRVQPNGDLTLELLGVRILSGFRKIVFTSHRRLQCISSSCGLARLAEISRITDSASR